MIEPAENIRLSFGAKYVAEDTASYILYRFDRSVLGGKAVPVERLARKLGLNVACETITGDCTRLLGVVTFEPQRVYTQSGSLDFTQPAAVVERDVIDRGECGLYNFTLAVMCAHFLFDSVKRNVADSGQLSFGLESVPSERKKEIDLETAFSEIARSDESAESFALKLVMPKNGFKRQTVEIYSLLGINRATLDPEKHLPSVLATLAERYIVPPLAVWARMRQLNLLQA